MSSGGGGYMTAPAPLVPGRWEGVCQVYIIIMTRSDQWEPPAVAIVRQNGLSSARATGKKRMCGCADMRMLQRVKCG